MTERTPTYPGRFVWYDLATTDQQAAQAFYTAVAGWGTNQFDMGGTPYNMWTVDGTDIGGIMQLPAEESAQGTPPHWIGYIGTEDVDATAARAASLGGTIMVPPTPIPTVGRFAVLADPSGAVFAIFTPEGDAPGREGAPAPGDFSWVELATRDLDAAFAFYSALFGWTIDTDMDMGPNGIYRIFAHHGQQMGGMYAIVEGMPFEMPPSWMYYIFVADIHAAAARVTAAGGTVLMGPHEIPGGMIIMARDPQGGHFAAHAMSAS